MEADFTYLIDEIRGDALIEEAVKDRVGAGRYHSDHVEGKEGDHQNLDVLHQVNVKHFCDDAEHTERQPAGKYCVSYLAREYLFAFHHLTRKMRDTERRMQLVFFCFLQTVAF